MTISEVCIFFTLVIFSKFSSASVSDLDCNFHDLSPPINSILCAIEQKKWYISKSASPMRNIGCLIGGERRCKEIMKIPIEIETPKSPAPPRSKSKKYQQLAMKAEEIVPQTWWRDSFADDKLLLSHGNEEFPRVLMDTSRLRNKKLKNLVQCVTRQQFIRKSLDFNVSDSNSLDSKNVDCNKASIIQVFYDQWILDGGMFGGVWDKSDGGMMWKIPQFSANNESKLILSAISVLDYFYESCGGIWTGCFKLEKTPECRGALAAAAIVVGCKIIVGITDKRKDFVETNLVVGYMLASLGRGLLHGDTSSTGNRPLTKWKVKCSDFIALQGAYLKLYIDSFGFEYTKQLNKHIPLAFPPAEFGIDMKKSWRNISQFEFEPIYTSLRNWMFHESSSLIDFGPYRPLVAVESARRTIESRSNRRVLVDVGANGFFASPKYLLDSYSVYLPFTDAIMIEPEPHFSASIPKAYSQRYNITFHQIYAEVGTGSENDMISLLPKILSKDDYVVLKFDVDPNRYAQGPTMEWGFLFSLMKHPNVAGLIDELYIELHFHFPRLYWDHYHSNWEALDALRFLRNEGIVIHAWP